MESKLLSMMKSKFESLFILSTLYKMVEAWNYEPAGRKKKGMGKVKEKEPYCPSVTFPFPYLLWFVNQDMGMQELNNRNLQPFWLASLPLSPHQAPYSFKLWISPCFWVEKRESL